MKKEYRPMALGFWGVGLPLVLIGIFSCRTAAQRTAVLLVAAVFGLVGTLVARAKE